nr:sensor histidine kinase [uncultured Allomuricauda sp.]
MKTKLLFVQLVLLAMGTNLGVLGQSANDPISFQHIKSGMSQSSATQIFEDSHGFLWIGTPNGLNRYDGTEFQVFEKGNAQNEGLTDGYIESIYEDNEGILYIGTNQGLNVYDRKINRVKPYPFLNSGKSLNTKYIGAIARSKDILWLGTDNSGVYKYNITTGETKQIRFDHIYESGPSNHYIVEVFVIAEDKLLIITQASVYIINKDLQVVSQIEQPQNISRAIRLSDTNYLLGSHDGDLIPLEVSSDDEFLTQNIAIDPGHSILSLSLDAQDKIWMGSENGGLHFYDPSTGEVQHLRVDVSKPNSITSNSIWSIHKAKNGVMWLGPFKNGLSFYDPQYHKFEHLKNNPFDVNTLSNNMVNSFLDAEDGALWIGTDGGGLNYWNRRENTFKTYALSNKKLNTDVVLSLMKDKENRLWVGSWANGLAIINPETMEYEVWNKANSFLASDNVTDMLQDRKGRIWIVTLFGGVHVYYPENGTHQHVSVRSERDGTETVTVARLFEDSKGQIWVGSQTSGLFRLVENNDKWLPYHYHTLHNERPISNDFINTIFEDSEGVLWIGTQSGLNKYDELSDAFMAYTKEDGLYNDAIKSIVEDEQGFLWLSTGKGIIQYNRTDGSSLHYDVDDGLQGNEFNAASFYKTASGELIFGGSNGFNIFNPKNVRKRQDVPRVFISELRVFNKVVLPGDPSGLLNRDISQTDTLTLAYDQDVIDFEFHALTYRHPKRVSFAYFLEGFETEWNYVGSDKHATYTNLSPRTYTLHIKSTNSDGIWVDNNTSILVQVLPPFWKTWWFKSAAIIGIILVVYLLYYLRVRNLKKYQNKLEKEIDQRTQELQQKQKKLMAAADELSLKNEEIQRFAFAVSHDLKSPLNSIKGIASLIPMEMDITSCPDMQEYVKYIDETCDTMNNLINDITKIAKLGKIENNNELLDTKEIVELAQSLVFGRLSAGNVKLYVDKKLPKIFGDRNRMIQVFENLVDNAIKYMGTQENPMVRIEAKLLQDSNQFMVMDNGSGMSKSDLEKLFTPFERFDGSVEGSGLGLYMVKKIIESHNGTISATSDGKEQGTTFMICLPKAELLLEKKGNKTPIKNKDQKVD